MKKILIALVCLFSLSSLFSEAKVVDFYGKVKVKLDGKPSWQSITPNMVIPDNATVSTGFNSGITLELENKTTLDVMPLTRMTIDEISKSGDTIKTSLLLQGGKIKADVKTVKGTINDFKIKSPVATASVRGTAFEFSGNTLRVIRGEVAFKPTRERVTTPSADKGDSGDQEVAADLATTEIQGVAVRAGGFSQMASAQGLPVKPEVLAEKTRSVEATTKPIIIKTPSVTVSDNQGAMEEVSVPSIINTAEKATVKTVTITVIKE